MVGTTVNCCELGGQAFVDTAWVLRGNSRLSLLLSHRPNCHWLPPLPFQAILGSSHLSVGLTKESRVDLSLCYGFTGLMTVLGFCGLRGATTFVATLVITLLVLHFPGKAPHEIHFYDENPRANHWMSPGIRIPALLAAQLRILVMVVRCFWQVWYLPPASGKPWALASAPQSDTWRAQSRSFSCQASTVIQPCLIHPRTTVAQVWIPCTTAAHCSRWVCAVIQSHVSKGLTCIGCIRSLLGPHAEGSRA